jgi:hypothetical protein
VIRAGFSTELDELRAVREGAVDFIASLQARERERTGIASLKVGFNKVFGYYLEVTRANLDRVPDDYVRKQTLSGGERYFTPELKAWEEKVTGAEERILALETELFQELRREVPRTCPGSRPRAPPWPASTCWPRWPTWPCAAATCAPSSTPGDRSSRGGTWPFASRPDATPWSRP